MGADKRSVSFDPDLAQEIDRAADEQGLSFSQWLAGAAAMRLRVRAGLRGVAEWEAEQGALKPSELAEADAVLDELLAPISARNAGRRTVRRDSRKRQAAG
jgi:hypothetical protein